MTEFGGLKRSLIKGIVVICNSESKNTQRAKFNSCEGNSIRTVPEQTKIQAKELKQKGK